MIKKETARRHAGTHSCVCLWSSGSGSLRTLRNRHLWGFSFSCLSSMQNVKKTNRHFIKPWVLPPRGTDEETPSQGALLLFYGLISFGAEVRFLTTLPRELDISWDRILKAVFFSKPVGGGCRSEPRNKLLNSFDLLGSMSTAIQPAQWHRCRCCSWLMMPHGMQGLACKLLSRSYAFLTFSAEFRLTGCDPSWKN